MFIKELKENPGMYDYIIIDSLTVLDNWSDIAGTYKFMNTPLGKNFNKDSRTGQVFSHNDPEWKSVTSIGDGNGWRWPRTWFMDQVEILTETLHLQQRLKDVLSLQQKILDHRFHHVCEPLNACITHPNTSLEH